MLYLSKTNPGCMYVAKEDIVVKTNCFTHIPMPVARPIRIHSYNAWKDIHGKNLTSMYLYIMSHLKDNINIAINENAFKQTLFRYVYNHSYNTYKSSISHLLK